MRRFNFLITLLVLPFYWLRCKFLLRHGTRVLQERELRRYAKHYFGFRRIALVPHGKQPAGACIYLANHQSRNDIFVALGVTKRVVRFVAKKELFDNPITRPFMELSQSYPLDREDPRQSIRILKQVLADVKEGHSVFAFPEGTRSNSIHMQPFKEGMFAILKRGTVPLVPVYIKESFNEKQRYLHVYFCEPLWPKEYQTLSSHELCETVYSRLEAKHHDLYPEKQ